MACLELEMGEVNEKEETGQELPDGLEEKQQNDELRQVEEHDYPEPMEENKDPNKKSNSDSLPMEEDEASPCSNENLMPEAETDPASDDKNVELLSDQEPDQASPPSSPLHEDQASVKPDIESTLDVKPEEHQELAESKTGRENESTISVIHTEVAEAASKDSITDASDLPEGHAQGDGGTVCVSVTHIEEPATPHYGSSDIKAEIENGEELNKGLHTSLTPAPEDNGNSNSKHSFLCYDDHMYYEGSESGTEEDQLEFMKELENFFKEMSMEFKPPKFYGEGLNCLKLWRAVNKLGGYEKVTSCKLWRQVGESFKPPKTCTTVSWTFRIFYEKALLDYERHKTRGGELIVPIASHIEPIVVENQGSGRARRDAAARAMQGWHSQRLVGNGEVSNPIIKDKNSIALPKREKQLKSVGLIKRKKPPHLENPVKAARTKIFKPQVDTAVVDIGAPADWVKINVQKTKDCYEIYALVPGLLREEVRVQSDPVGRLVISGEPEQPDNPWGVTPFKKVVSLPSRIDPHQTSAVVTLHGQLFIRAPLEQPDI